MATRGRRKAAQSEEIGSEAPQPPSKRTRGRPNKNPAHMANLSLQNHQIVMNYQQQGQQFPNTPPTAHMYNSAPAGAGNQIVIDPALGGGPSGMVGQMNAPRFIEEQAGARPVSPIDSQQLSNLVEAATGQLGDTIRVHSSAAGGHNTGEIDITQDGGFETHPAEPAAAQKRRESAKRKSIMKAQNNVAKHKRHDLQSAAQNAQNVSASVEGHLGVSDGTDAGMVQDAGEDASESRRPFGSAPPSSNYQEVNRTAKQNEIIRAQDRPPQQRLPWTPDEVNALIDYIARYGTSWSLIKKNDETEGRWLAKRTQVNLKDKARNMKLDYLKAGAILPPNFQDIMLDKKAKDKLASMDIEYSQQQVRKPR